MNDEVIYSNNKASDNPGNNPGGLTVETQRLFEQYQKALSPKSLEGATIQVDEIASKVAALYERIREIIDWKEEHLIGRTAIERGLKRRMVSELSGLNLISALKAEEIAGPLVLELIRAGHFPNNQIPQKRLVDVEKILRKYIFILANSPLAKNGSPAGIKRKVNFYDWILEIAACEIEEILNPPLKQDALVEYMTNLMVQRIQVTPESAISSQNKRIQTEIAVYRTLFRLDDPIISYRLLKNYYPQWSNLPEPVLVQLTKNILSVRSKIEKKLNHFLANDFYRVCEQQDTLYLILGDVLGNFASQPSIISEKLAEPKNLESLIREAYNKRVATLKRRLFRMAIFSTLSVLIASGFSLFVVEVPLAKLLYGKFNLLSIAVDILLPTVLMFFLVALVRPPGKKNLDKVISEIKKIVYRLEGKDVYEIKAKKQRKVLVALVVSLLYLLGSCLSLGLVFWIFYIARVPITSVYIDTLNVAMIVFAALIVRQRAKELVVEEKTSFWEFFLDTLFVPVGRIGQWLSDKWKEYNIVSVFFTILIDTPFQALIGFIESWSTFIKEKKAQIH